MEYRLKKDLPFAKAGTEVFDDRYGYISVKNLITKDGGSFFIGYDLTTLISEDWIEEVKPREFWVEIRKSDNVATDVYEGKPPSSLNMIEKHNYIKVREVI